MKVTTFQDLLVWQKAHQLTLSIYNLTKKFPSDERFGLSAQIRKSASSICANIVEGYTKSTNDFLRYLYISRGLLEETKYHLILSKDLNYISGKEFEKLFYMSKEAGRMLSGLIESIKSRKFSKH